VSAEVVTTPGDVAIVGTGQIGTMLGLAIMAARSSGETGVGRVTLYDADDAAAAESLERGAGDSTGRDVGEAFAAATVLLATPVPDIVRLVDRYGGEVRPGALVLDTGTTKREVVAAMRRRVPPDAHAVGGHPLAGTEQGGPGGARPELLAGAAFALTPVRPDPEGIALARAFVESTGAIPLEIDADRHDRAVAFTIHLPQLLATALALTVAGRASSGDGREPPDPDGPLPEPDVVASFVSSGYLGVSRLALSSPGSTAAFLRANGDNLRDAAGRCRRLLDELVSSLDDTRALERLLAEGAAARRSVAGNRT
jgi:prephenate dehydrogenase